MSIYDWNLYKDCDCDWDKYTEELKKQLKHYNCVFSRSKSTDNIEAYDEDQGEQQGHHSCPDN